MTEEYMTSAELTQEISELKMRLALQIEYEKELEAVLKEASVQDTDDVQMEEMHLPYKKVRHPANGGAKLFRQQISDILGK